ncbi:helix-turn-helix domain-containing protein [Nocardioides sp. CER19]|uniref:arsenate reductase/protein-tyrosine-phosphatase family protein n=1 Tax=Nocardioides sp. CER19 TaxID=3038538 RepID=UPI00244A851B|nr:helix-turn-helix domain-containing protein [Nocardioides sp. CER19]MDH2413041.1 helix-turn-helix domain-containing protein [Nocardioides sp. CER19]
MSELERRAAVHAALGDVARLRVVDTLRLGDASPSELSTALGMPSNLLAFHLKALESAGLITRHRSEGDGRRTYLRLVRDALDGLGLGQLSAPERVVFVSTANSARSHLAAALWRRASDIPTASAGTHPAERIDPGAVEAAGRRQLPLPRVRPQHLDEVLRDGDVVVTVCDRAHEELRPTAATRLHWSIPDPVRVGTEAAYDAAYDELAARVVDLAQRYPRAS